MAKDLAGFYRKNEKKLFIIRMDEKPYYQCDDIEKKEFGGKS